MVGNCYSADYIAEDHIHTDITCNRSTAFEWSAIDYWEGGGGGEGGLRTKIQ